MIGGLRLLAAASLLVIAGCAQSPVDELLAGYEPERIAALEETMRESNTEVDKAQVLSALQFQDMCGSMVRAVAEPSDSSLQRLRDRAEPLAAYGDTAEYVAVLIRQAEQGDLSGMRQFILANQCEPYAKHG